MQIDSTETLHPIPRPGDLWRAWEQTASYVAQITKSETVVHLGWNSQGVDAPWMAQFEWMGNRERVAGLSLAGEALSALWEQIEAQYKLFPNRLEARRAPRGYPPDRWFVPAEITLMKRLTSLDIAGNNTLITTLLLTYHAQRDSEDRLVACLIAHEAAITMRGHGPTLLKACQDLYPRVVQQFST